MSSDYIAHVLNPVRDTPKGALEWRSELGGQPRVADGAWPLARETESLEHQHGDQQEQSQGQRAD